MGIADMETVFAQKCHNPSKTKNRSAHRQYKPACEIVQVAFIESATAWLGCCGSHHVNEVRTCGNALTDRNAISPGEVENPVPCQTMRPSVPMTRIMAIIGQATQIHHCVAVGHGVWEERHVLHLGHVTHVVRFECVSVIQIFLSTHKRHHHHHRSSSCRRNRRRPIVRGVVIEVACFNIVATCLWRRHRSCVLRQRRKSIHHPCIQEFRIFVTDPISVHVIQSKHRDNPNGRLRIRNCCHSGCEGCNCTRFHPCIRRHRTCNCCHHRWHWDRSCWRPNQCIHPLPARPQQDMLHCSPFQPTHRSVRHSRRVGASNHFQRVAHAVLIGVRQAAEAFHQGRCKNRH